MHDLPNVIKRKKQTELIVVILLYCGRDARNGGKKKTHL